MTKRMYTFNFVSLFLFGILMGQANSSEPLCSKYDYDEKLLERMIQVQFDVKQFAKTLVSIRKEVDDFMVTSKKILEDKTSSIDKKQEEIQREINNVFKQQSATLSEIVSNVSDTIAAVANQTTSILFRASISSSIDIKAGSRIVFPNVQENKGGAYKSENGVFTAPCPGLYMFSLQLCTDYKIDARFGIYKGELMLSGRRNIDEDRDSCGTMVVLVSLKKGDTVQAKCVRNCDLSSVTENSNLFSGILMHEIST